MRIDVVTLFPDEFRSMVGVGVTGRAMSQGRVSLDTWNPRDYAEDRHNTVDDRPYGGGPGMVMTVEPLRSTIRAARQADHRPVSVGLLSPQGRQLDQAAVRELAGRERILLVCGRYEGIDERLVRLEVDEEWSIGDYVLSGGELAAAVMIDALLRLLPGVLGDAQSAEQDSFTGDLLDHPHYSRPESVEGLDVPPVLLSGDHGAIARWRLKQALGRTWKRRPDLLENKVLDEESKALLQSYIDEHEH
ncbi:tRNA (guanosine(37)-N1)-methyltransferase TrmD [Marinihelvus fidelis]|uniref:tRNA (guanine-N(1)-)-methyltransferase n=1 Tax=Marinihelvus fidelis TaxID=2613842 RepID=A0A5N0TA62_9GAMM|nr:tRNA (guanosine(37)-N1)-methyltransferase TrmD [Marinihelvus fidelis]KAA9131895.1 tRNA (guanosine(37)-N1)-methyltransferase TrmD [Marinihelvus fidelis]